MANVINSLKLGDGTYVFTTPYATCDTAAATAAKVATITPSSNFSLEKGARVAVQFDNANTAGSPTLNVNNTGAKAIYFKNAALTSSNYWSAKQIIDFIYDGNYWVCSAVVTDNNTDTKNTAGSMNTSNKIYLIGATSQAANPATYSHDTAYVGTDGCLYSNGKKVATVGDNNTFTGTNTFETKFQSSLYRTIIDKNGVSVGSGPSSGILVSTTYDYNRINYTNSGTTYMYYFPSANGTLALTDDCITIIERNGLTLPTKTASTTIALTDEEKALIVKDPSKVMFKINLSNVFYYSGAHGPTYRYDPVYPRSGDSYYIQVDQRTGSPCIMFITLQGVVTSNPALSGSESTLTSISINGTSYKIGDVTAAGNNTFTGSNTFTKHFSVYDEVSGNRSTIDHSALTLESPNINSTCMLNAAGLIHKQMSSDGAITLHNTTLAFGNNGSTTTITVPNKTGTLALTSDLPDTSNFVTLSGAQTISGHKTFNNHITLHNGPDGYLEVGSWKFFGYSLNNGTGTSLSFPSGKNGTIALTSDIDVKSAGNNTFTGSNTFTFDETETTGSLYRTLIDQHGISVGAGPRSGIMVDTTYGINNIRYSDSGTTTTYTYAFPNKSGTFALTSDIPIKTATLSGTTLSITLS